MVTSLGFEENKVKQCIYLKGAYIDRVMEMFNMQNCKPGDVPVTKGDKLSKDQCPKNEIELA